MRIIQFRAWLKFKACMDSGWYAKSLEDPSKQVAGYGNLFNCKNIEIIGNIYENPELSNSQCKKQ
jgi:hypothetical protein